MSRSMNPSSPGDGLVKDRIGQVEILLARELGRGHRLAARDAGQVRDDALHLVKAAVFQIGLRGGGQRGGKLAQISHGLRLS
jgi:hypothetical protein